MEDRPDGGTVAPRAVLAPGISLALLHATPTAVVAMDMEGRITTLNAAAERLLSTAAHDATGRLYPDVFGPSLANRLLGLYVRASQAGSAAAHTLTATLPSGRRATLRANAGPLRDGAGTVIGVFFVAEEPEARAAAGPGDPSGARDAQLRKALRRYLGSALAEQVAERPSFVNIGGVRQVISVLHADVRGYTTVAEAMEPELVSDLLLRYHGTAVAALQREAATIDRYIGDAILALWNAPTPQADHARLAVRGALALRQATQALGRDMEYGIDLHTGDAVVGNLGSDQYLHYTAIGDTVNVAARLQSAAPAGGIVCSGALLRAAGAGLRATTLGFLTVKGRKNAVEAYTIEGIEV
jgi:PAS domain S-box-containing protein